MNKLTRLASVRPARHATAICAFSTILFAGSATAATVTSGSVNFFDGSDNGSLRFGFALQDLETPAEFAIDLAPGEVITNVSINVIAPSPPGTFSQIGQLALSFSPEAVLSSSTESTWNQMANYNRTTSDSPTVAPGSTFPNLILLDTSTARLQDSRVEISEAAGFIIGGSDFTLTFDPNTLDVAAVPLPPAALFLASGLAGIAAVGRRKKKKKS